MQSQNRSTFRRGYLKWGIEAANRVFQLMPLSNQASPHPRPSAQIPFAVSREARGSSALLLKPRVDKARGDKASAD